MRTLPLVLALGLPACDDYDDSALQARVAALEEAAESTEVAELKDRLEAAESTIADLETDLAAAQADLSTYVGDLGDLEAQAVLLLDSDMTISVGSAGDYATLHEALASLDRYRIASDAKVTIQIADGTYALSETLEIGHPDGGQIHILGNTEDPSTVVLTFAVENAAAIMIRQNAAVADIAGLTIRGVHQGGADGVLIQDGAYARLGQVTVEDFGRNAVYVHLDGTLKAVDLVVRGSSAGLVAQWGSTIYAPGVTATGCDSRGILALNNSTILADGATVGANGAEGVLAYLDSYVSAANATSTDSGLHGYAANGGSTLYASGATADTSTSIGFYSVNGSLVIASDAIAVDNGNSGFHADWGSVLKAERSTSTNSHRGYAAFQQSIVSAMDGGAVDNDLCGFDTSMGAIIHAADSTNSDNETEFCRATTTSAYDIDFTYAP